MESFFERLQKRFAGGGREITLLWIMGIVGFFLLANSRAFFEFFGLVEVPECMA